MTSLQIGLILPDILGTYGDDGNALVLRQRARMRGHEAEIVPIKLGEPVPDSLDVTPLAAARTPRRFSPLSTSSPTAA